ncbi:hypothetical protein DPMN_040687 [Dreissena polymorpha]|uniref:Uncharacterized protein n=1 Tax=Dreissena polymorpha TaxID=45954 RepID=A0A9D4CVI0_DREPO|nr:hypothetical protein DPMN_040687 [Dreissena polymorpha]
MYLQGGGWVVNEEVTWEYKDSCEPVNLILLDAKAAIDVVDNFHLLRMVNQADKTDIYWSIKQRILTDARSDVKWSGELSELFNINQGMRQVVLLGTELYYV